MADKKIKRVIASVYSVGIAATLAAVMLFTLFLTGQAADIFIEIEAVVLLSVSFILIADILKKFLKKAEILEALIFPLILFLIIFAPVIFDVRVLGIKFIPRLDPIYYYLSVIEDGRFYDFILFFAALLSVDKIISFIKLK